MHNADIFSSFFSSIIVRVLLVFFFEDFGGFSLCLLAALFAASGLCLLLLDFELLLVFLEDYLGLLLGQLYEIQFAEELKQSLLELESARLAPCGNLLNLSRQYGVDLVNRKIVL